MDQETDAELVEASQAGNVGALDALLRRHHARLWALCRRLTGDPVDADDACQEALVALARGLARFDGRSTFATWAYRVTTNTCLDELRRRRRRPVPTLDVGAEPDHGVRVTQAGRRGPSAVTGPVAASGPDTAEGVAARLDVDAALATLAVEFRTAVVLRDLCQLSYAEIAEVLGVPAGTVRSRIARGRAALLAVLGGNREPTPGRRNP